MEIANFWKNDKFFYKNTPANINDFLSKMNLKNRTQPVRYIIQLSERMKM